MPNVTISDKSLIDKLKTDDKLRERLLVNTHKLLSEAGVKVSENDIKSTLQKQLAVKPTGAGVADTFTIINIMATQ